METIYTIENIYIDIKREFGLLKEAETAALKEGFITEVRLKLKEKVQFGEDTQLSVAFGWCNDTYKTLFNFLNAFPHSDTELIIGERVLRFEEDGVRKFKVLSTGIILNDVLKEE